MIKNYIKHFEFTEKEIAEGKYDPWDLIEPFWYKVSIYDGLDVYNQDMAGMTVAQRRFLALFWYDSEVCNGGHDQFFSNSTGIVWKDALEGMRMIGDDADADNFQKAIDLFGGDISFDRDERNDALDKIYEKNGYECFEDINHGYYGGDKFDKYMKEYVKSHPVDFVVNGDFPYSEFVL
jgi:hypothetical protein